MQKMARFLLFLIGFLSSPFCMMVESAKILCASHQFGSHMMMVHSTVEGLIQRGHEAYTIYSDKMPVPKGLEEKGFKILKYHTPEGSQIMFDPHQEDIIMDSIFNGTTQDIAKTSAITMGECFDMDNDKNLEQQLLDLRFDIAILDVFPLSKCLTFIPLKLKIPFILVPPALEPEATRIPLLPSFFPVALLQMSDQMAFPERLYNTLISIVISAPALSPFPSVTNTKLLEKYNDDPAITSWNGLARKAELHLISRGGMVEYASPLNPNVINIECLTCKPGKPLSDDILNMADSSDGIIVVSFGSLITHFPDEVAKRFLEAFSQRKELIFWRYKAKLPGTVPPNVKIMKWLPQNDLLAHPKTKLFITHSGNNGQYESVYHGVPMLAFPLFAEQHHNAHRITVHGYGLMCQIATLCVKEFAGKMDTIIGNPSFYEKTQRASKIFKSLPMNAQETSAYWIEHVLEFGSEHLRSHALDMPWYAFYMLDIIIFIEAVIAVVFFIISLVIFAAYKKLCHHQPGGKLKKN